jgi:putative PIN family toxin of toxin-antitoxin system
MRAVLDPNVLISALLSPEGAPAWAVRAWIGAAFELIASELLLAELARALGYRKLRTRITSEEVRQLIDLIRREASIEPDPPAPPSVTSPDPGDDYLIALAESTRAVIVSDDAHLLGLADRIPVYAPAAFVALLTTQDR